MKAKRIPDEKLFQDVLSYLSAGTDCTDVMSEEELESVSAEKLERLLSGANETYDQEKLRLIRATIDSFLHASNVQRNKLLSYCLNYFDPTAKSTTITENGEEILPHSYLGEDELTKLYRFVQKHTSDNTFDSTVRSVMERHGMNPPDVYKNAMMSRQDFSRATEIGNTSVTRRLVWQIIVGLHCDPKEADQVLFSAGYIRRRTKFDLTMQYFIEHKNYDIMAINDVLYKLKLKLFSCYKSVKDKDNQ